MNNCSFSGRITKDPELKTAESGKKYVRFCLAVKRRVKSGEHPQSDFIDCLAWEKTAEIMVKYCKKGDLVGITGRLQTNPYEKDGEKRKSIDVIVNEIDFLGGNKPSEQNDSNPSEQIADEGELPFEV